MALGRQRLGPRQLNHLVRFEPVLDLVRACVPSGGTLLDVGSGSEGISTLLPESWRVTAVDASFDDYAPRTRHRPLLAEQQIGDVRDLPFGDGSFDVAVAVDLLEHVPAADRDRAVSEICRVSRRLAVIACPAGQQALAGDRRLARWFAQRGRPVPAWLTEHLDHGFPEPTGLTAAARHFGEVRLLGNESIQSHERLVAAEHRLVPALLLRLACRPLEWMMTSRRARARRWATAVLDRVRGFDAQPTYRAIVIVGRPATVGAQ